MCVAKVLFALLRGRDVVRAPLRTRGAPCACALVVRVAAHPPLGHVRGRTVAVTPSAGHGWFGAYLAGHFVQYNNTHGKAAWLKRLPPGRSAPPPTAGGVKVLFSCHAPHVAVNLKEGRAKEAQKAQPAAHGTVAVLAQGSRISVKPKTLPNSGHKILACTSPARAVERARLGPSGSLPRDQGAPLRRRGHFSRLAPA